MGAAILYQLERDPSTQQDRRQVCCTIRSHTETDPPGPVNVAAAAPEAAVWPICAPVDAWRTEGHGGVLLCSRNRQHGPCALKYEYHHQLVHFGVHVGAMLERAIIGIFDCHIERMCGPQKKC